MKVVSLFSGVGGFDLGFIRAGHDVVWANDIWKDATETYKMNIGNHVVCADLKDIPSDEIPDCDIVIGGFPCQGFSVANTKRHTGDERNKLYLEFVRVVKDKKPQYFVAENVKGILSIEKGAAFKMIIKDFSDLGYSVKYSVLNAANYGIPQSRERVIILGVRKDLRDETNFPPIPTHTKKNGTPLFGLEQWIGVGEALKNIPEPESSHNLKNHQTSKYKLTFNGYLGHREIDPLMPCPTITSRGDEKGGVVVHHHPNNHRRISPREAAIIQAFDIDFEFYGGKTSNYRQISNAVPPKLAEVIAKTIPHNLS